MESEGDTEPGAKVKDVIKNILITIAFVVAFYFFTTEILMPLLGLR